LAVEIRELQPGKDVDDFVRAGYEVFGDDPSWVAPLELVLRERLDPAKDPFYRHADVTLFTAWKDGRLAGRASATVDRNWLATWHDETGHFGYFDTRDDQEVASALLQAAEDWLRRRGMRRMNGPMSLTANHDVGVLIDGFEHPPVVDMAHSRSWQAALAEQCGLVKEKDLFAWRYDSKDGFNARSEGAWQKLAEMPEIHLRSVSLRRMREELGLLMQIYNETWAGKWGYVPLDSDELDKIASDLKLVIDPELAFVAELNGEPAGMCITVPNLNEAIADLRGRLFPFGWAKLLWRTKVSHPRSARVILLGVREAVRKNVKKYGFLSTAMYVEVAKRGGAKGYEWAELSWTREDDAPINLGIRAMGGRAYKTYRVYEKRL
jgi:GNAT superfamily N-acetyltransferase